MSVAQLKRRTDALQKMSGSLGLRSYTLEELCRMLWRIDKRRCEELARKGDTNVAFFIRQFKMEEALTAGAASSP